MTREATSNSGLGDLDPLADAEERQVIFAALDSYR